MKNILSVLALLALSNGTYAQQDITPFKLTDTKKQVANSKYNTIRFVDSRADTNALGFVLKGAFNKQTRLVPQPNLQTQLSDLLHKSITPDAQAGKLLFHLRHGAFSEVTGMSETGIAVLYADLYAVDKDTLRRLATLDTTVAIRNSMADVTERLLSRSSIAMVEFMENNLSREPVEGALALALAEKDFAKLDALEKEKMPLYTLQTLRDGVYKNYQSLANQTPEAGIKAVWRKERPAKMQTIDLKTGETESLLPYETYAVVFEGKPFLFTETGMYPLQKKEANYFYEGRIPSSARTGAVVAASVAFGIIGGLVASAADRDQKNYIVQLSHFNGAPVVMGVVPEKEETRR